MQPLVAEVVTVLGVTASRQESAAAAWAGLDAIAVNAPFYPVANMERAPSLWSAFVWPATLASCALHVSSYRLLN